MAMAMADGPIFVSDGPIFFMSKRVKSLSFEIKDKGQEIIDQETTICSNKAISLLLLTGRLTGALPITWFQHTRITVNTRVWLPDS